jgi:hypothetical protein
VISSLALRPAPKSFQYICATVVRTTANGKAGNYPILRDIFGLLPLDIGLFGKHLKPKRESKAKYLQ